MTLEELLTALATWCDDRGLARSTLVTYETTARHYWRWWAAERSDRSVATAAAGDIRAYLEHVRQTCAAPGFTATASTINKYRSALAALYRALVNQGLAATNPVQAVAPMPQGKPRPRWLSERERERLLPALEGAPPRQRIVGQLMLIAGLRREEVVTLTWGQVTDRHLRIVGKRRKERRIPLPRPLAIALGQWKQHQERNGQPVGPGDRVIPVSQRTVARDVAALAKIGGVKKLTPHMLRHTFCRGLRVRGARLEEVADLAGHDSLETTRRYTTPSDEELALAMERLVEL